MRAFIFLVLIFFATGNVASASSIFSQGDLYFESVADHRDIPDGIVTSLAQDRDGFIWIGTQQGAVRYDGYQFVQFTHKPDEVNSLAGNYIRTIWNAPDGKIWFGTFSDGISILDPKDNSFEHFDFSTEQDTRNGNSIRAIVGEASQRVWVATNQGLNYLNPYSKQVVAIKSINGCETVYQDKGPRSLYLDNSRGLWLGTQNGLCRINLPSENYQQDVLSGRSFAEFDGIQIHTMTQSRSKALLIGTLQKGLARFDPDSHALDWLGAEAGGLGHPWVVSIAESDTGEAWIGTLDGGITLVDATTLEVLKQVRHDRSIASSINQNNIGALFKDRTGLIWIGTWGAGLNLFAPQNDSIRTLRHSPYREGTIKSARIRAIAEADNGDIWLGYSQAGLSRISKRQGTVTHFDDTGEGPQSLPENDILSLLHTQNGEIWVGTRRKGLFSYNPVEKRFIPFPAAAQKGFNTITTMVTDSKQRLWIGSTKGVAYIDLQDYSLNLIDDYAHYDPVKGRITYTLTWQNPASLWVGTDDGLFHLNPNAKTVQEINVTPGQSGQLSDNAINSLHVDKNNQLWVATESGLDKLDSWDGQKATFVSVNQSLNIEQEYTANILSDHLGRLWHYKGVYDIENQQSINLSQNNKWDIGTIWLGSQTLTTDGSILFGGNQGLLLINPGKFTYWPFQPPLVVSRAEVDGQLINLDPNTPLQLSPETKGVSLEFSALDYTGPEKIRYRWRLAGFDEKWQYGNADNRRATYTNLSPGKYRLEVESTNSTGVWTDNRMTIEMVSLPAWYETWWFLLSVLLGLLLFIWYLFVARTHHLVRQKKKLDQQIYQKTQELIQVNNDKDRIMSIIAHDINNKISIGLGYLDLIKMTNQIAPTSELNSYLEQAINAGKGCSDLVEELRDYGKLSNESNEITLKTNNIVKTLARLVEAHQPKALAKQLQLHFQYQEDVIFCDLHQAKFARVIENLLSNAIKFSSAGQTINLSIGTSGKNARIIVADQGIGIPENIRAQLFSAFTNSGRSGTSNEKSTGLGLYIVKKLVEQHRGRVWFESEENKGSQFYIELPLTDEAIIRSE